MVQEGKGNFTLNLRDISLKTFFHILFSPTHVLLWYGLHKELVEFLSFEKEEFKRIEDKEKGNGKINSYKPQRFFFLRPKTPYIVNSPFPSVFKNSYVLLMEGARINPIAFLFTRTSKASKQESMMVIVWRYIEIGLHHALFGFFFSSWLSLYLDFRVDIDIL